MLLQIVTQFNETYSKKFIQAYLYICWSLSCLLKLSNRGTFALNCMCVSIILQPCSSCRIKQTVHLFSYQSRHLACFHFPSFSSFSLYCCGVHLSGRSLGRASCISFPKNTLPLCVVFSQYRLRMMEFRGFT